MNRRSNRGAAPLILIYGLAALFSAGTWAYFKVTEPGRNKKVADKSAAAAQIAEQHAQESEKKAQASEQAVKEMVSQNQEERAVRDKIDDNAGGFLWGAGIAIAADPNPSDADQVATQLIESAKESFGVHLTDAQKAFWQKTVAGLIKKNAEARAEIDQLTKEAIKTRAKLGEQQARTDAAEQHATQLAKDLTKTNQQLVDETKKTSDLTARNKQWADGEQTWWGRAKAAGILCVIVLIVIVGGSIKIRGLHQTLLDSVALGHHVEQEVARGVTTAEGLRQSISSWWEDDQKGKAKLQTFKSKLRL